VFVRDRLAGTTRLMSKSTANVAGTSSSDQPSISPGGRFVAFRSFSGNLVAAPSGSRIYVRDRQANTTTNMPLPPGAESCEEPRISDLGDIIAQCSMPSPTSQQVFLYRAAAGAFYQLSTSVSAGDGNGTSGNATGISADGNLMVFDSAASDLVPSDSNSATDAFIAADLDGLNALFADGFE
jgi:Tol biopolymer transport system component